MFKKIKSINLATRFLLAVVFIYIVFTLYIFLAFKDNWAQSGTFGDSFGVLNTLFSGLALTGVIYTLNLQVRSLELQRKDSKFNLMPLLAVEPVEEHKLGYTLAVSNIGNGTAMNLEFIPLMLSEDTPIVFRANMFVSLRAGETKNIEITPFLQGLPAAKEWTAHFRKGYATKEMIISINYEDIEFNKMRQSFSLGMGDLKVKMVQNR